MSWAASRRRSAYLNLNALLCILVLYLPIATLIIFSFNAARGTLAWGGFSLQWFRAIFVNPSIILAIARSLEVALVSATIATILGLMTVLGLRRTASRTFAKRYEALLMLPMLVPEIVTAVGLLTTFANLYRPVLVVLGLEQNSLVALVAGHLTFALAYVVVILKARVHHLDPALEDAAKNLGATRLQIFFMVTLPQLFPAIVCAFLLVFTLSLDDFYLSHFLTYGGTGYTTLPVYLFGLQARSALTPEMNAVASLMILTSLTLVAVAMIFYSQWMRKEQAHHAV